MSSDRAYILDVGEKRILRCIAKGDDIGEVGFSHLVCLGLADKGLLRREIRAGVPRWVVTEDGRAMVTEIRNARAEDPLAGKHWTDAAERLTAARFDDGYAQAQATIDESAAEVEARVQRYGSTMHAEDVAEYERIKPLVRPDGASVEGARRVAAAQAPLAETLVPAAALGLPEVVAEQLELLRKLALGMSTQGTPGDVYLKLVQKNLIVRHDTSTPRWALTATGRAVIQARTPPAPVRKPSVDPFERIFGVSAAREAGRAKYEPPTWGPSLLTGSGARSRFQLESRDTLPTVLMLSWWSGLKPDKIAAAIDQLATAELEPPKPRPIDDTLRVEIWVQPSMFAVKVLTSTGLATHSIPRESGAPVDGVYDELARWYKLTPDQIRACSRLIQVVPPKPVCDRCDDTHRMDLEDHTVMCTHCPTPCQKCRQGGTGPCCASTPCKCTCHPGNKPAAPRFDPTNALKLLRAGARAWVYTDNNVNHDPEFPREDPRELEAEFQRAALRWAAAKLEEAGECGTSSACTLLLQLAAAIVLLLGSGLDILSEHINGDTWQNGKPHTDREPTKSSDNVANAWDDVAVAWFYSRDISYDGSCSVVNREPYGSLWWFQTVAERDRFLAWLPTFCPLIKVVCASAADLPAAQRAS